MAQDPYSDCPCGSGKKLKFCCPNIVGEMEKVNKLRRNNQTRTAIQTLQKLTESHPDSPWVTIVHAEILMEERNYEAALQLMAAFAQRFPDHTSGLVLLAIVHLFARGFDQAKRTIHRCFQKCTKSHPAAISQIADGIASMMYANDSFLSARQHLTLAVRYAPPQHRGNLFMKMASLESNDSIPYPLRSVHQLQPFESENEEVNRDGQRAVRLSAIGCWEPAAILFRRASEAEPDNAALLYNLGLCLAWDGDEVGSAIALHSAAEKFADTELAVEAETLAQLLDLETTADVTRFIAYQYTFDSTSQLLTTLDEQSSLERIRFQESDEEYSGEKPVAVYRMISRELLDDEDSAGWSLQDVPETVAEIAVFDSEDIDPHLQVSGSAGDAFTQAVESLKSMYKLEDTDSGELELGVVPNEMMPLARSWHFPEETPGIVRRRLETEQLSIVTLKEWPDRELPSLGHKTPRSMSQEDNNKVKVRAAVHVLDAWCDRHAQHLDRTTLDRDLGLPASELIDPDDSLVVANMSAMQLQRISVEKLNDEQLLEIVNRALLVRQPELTEKVLVEVVTREECLKKVGEVRAYSGLFRCCRDQNRRDEALKWLASARDATPQDKKEFQHRMEWDLRELSFRLEDPSDEKLPETVRHIEQEYCSKLPEMREVLVETLAEAGLQSLLSDELVTSAEGIWTPGSDAGGEGESKLYIPGE